MMPDENPDSSEIVPPVKINYFKIKIISVRETYQ
jgi:hypothetical protein